MADEGNLGFAFNDIDKSDRILRLQILPVASKTTQGAEKYLNWFSSIHGTGNDSECGTDFKVKTLNISSPILAAKSRFFFKLFKNEQQKDAATLRLNASEQTAFIDLLNFMYGKTLRATSAPDLLDVLMAAEVFEVTSCIKNCVQMLLKLPMSLESAHFYLEIPSIVFAGESVQPLIDAAKQYLTAQYKDFTKSKEETMKSWPLSAVEAVLGIDGLLVNSEDDVFDFIFKWARGKYPKLEERREIITKLLAQYVCFSYLSCSKLKNVADSSEFDYETPLKVMLKSLLICKGENSIRGFPRRVYNHRLIKVVHYEYAQPRCVVYFDLKKEDCAGLFPPKYVRTEAFFLGGRVFSLLAQCIKEQYNSDHFGLYVEMTGSGSCSLSFEFSVMKKPRSYYRSDDSVYSKEFESQVKIEKITLEAGKSMGPKDLFKTSWTSIMSDDSEYFIDGILHLRAQLTINN